MFVLFMWKKENKTVNEKCKWVILLLTQIAMHIMFSVPSKYA